MGRELRRKQAKKEGKSLKPEVPVEKNEIKGLLIITLILVIIIAVIYLLSALFVTKELDWFSKDNDKELIAEQIEIKTKKGKVNYRTDSFGNVHGIFGKASFDEGQLVDNLKTFIEVILKVHMKNKVDMYPQRKVVYPQRIC